MLKFLKKSAIVAFNVASAVGISYVYYKLHEPIDFTDFLIGGFIFWACFSKIFSHGHNFSGSWKNYYYGEITQFTSRFVMNSIILGSILLLTLFH